MKKFLPLILLITFFTAAKAQFVTIPDANFRAFLKSKYPTCFNTASEMDTTCAAILQIRDTINCSNLNISSLEGIQYFKRLSGLNCSHNLLESIPKLSDSLANLNCSYNQLSSLPLSILSDYLLSLDCSYNNLTSLPAMPEFGFRYIPLAYGRTISCQHNKIICLPLIKNVQKLSIDSTIACINYGGGYADFDYPMNIFCYKSNDNVDTFQLPAPNFNYRAKGYPRCNPANNPNHCPSLNVIKGNIFYDNNKNGLKDIGEFDAAGVPVNLSNAKAYTDWDGNYQLSTILTGNYNLTITPPNYYTCLPINVPVIFSGKDTLITQHFALQATQNVDSLVINITPTISRARPGFAYSMLISYKNAGTTNLTPNIIIDYEETKLSYDSSSDHSVINTITALNLSAGTLMPGEFKSFVAYFKVKPSVAIGDSILSFATITNGVVTATDSSKSYVTGSFDPNDKQATPILTPSQVTNGEYIDYTIRFQNTGNDTAFNIVIADTLDAQLQPASFVMVNSSHPCNTTFTGNIVYFEFLNILLPDSNINEPASHGFVTFKIQALKTVAINDVIPNKAYIYFDYNAPVITNVATTTIYLNPLLPINLKDFSVSPTSNNQLLVKWVIENELNSKNFELQVSTDGTHFTGIGTITARGVSSYSFASAMPEEMITYYRLKINDKNGSSSYSNILKVQQQKTKAGLLVTNPVKNNLIINVTDKNLENTEAVLVNSNGQVIKKITLHFGIQNSTISNATKGTYYLKTKQGNIKLIVL